MAIAAAVPLWAATMAGGVADALRGSQETPSAPTVEGPATPDGDPALAARFRHLPEHGRPGEGGRRARAAPRSRRTRVLAAADDLVGGITLAVALGGPLLAAAVVIEIAGAIIARAASPAQVHTLIAPLRALGTLAIMGVVFERLAVALAKVIEAAP